MNPSYIVSIIQIVIAVFLVVSVLLQQRGSSLGGAFGGSESASFTGRRGAEKKLYYVTIILGVSFILVAFLQLLL